MPEILTISIGLGSKTLPSIKDAMAHAIAFPSHNPIIRIDLTANPKESLTWQCLGDDGMSPCDYG